MAVSAGPRAAPALEALCPRSRLFRLLLRAAMGGLVALANRAREAGGGLRLVAVSPPVARILSLVRLDRFFDIDDDVETSLKSCRISSATWVAPEQDHQGWVVLKMPRSLDAN